LGEPEMTELSQEEKGMMTEYLYRQTELPNVSLEGTSLNID